MDLHAGAVLGDKAMPNGRMKKWMEETLTRGPWWVCQNGISEGQEDRHNRGMFLYSDRRWTTGGGAAEMCKPGGGRAAEC